MKRAAGKWDDVSWYIIRLLVLYLLGQCPGSTGSAIARTHDRRRPGARKSHRGFKCFAQDILADIPSSMSEPLSGLAAPLGSCYRISEDQALGAAILVTCCEGRSGAI